MTNPLFMSVKNGHVDASKLLICNGAIINNSHLTACVRYSGNELLLEVLLENANNARHWIDAALISSSHNVNYIKILLNNNANPNIRDHYGWTALMRAIRRNYIDVVRILIEHDANVNYKRKDGLTALYMACRQGNLEIVKLLVEKGSNIHISRGHITPLQIALHNKRDEVVLYIKSLIDRPT